MYTIAGNLNKKLSSNFMRLAVKSLGHPVNEIVNAPSNATSSEPLVEVNPILQ